MEEWIDLLVSEGRTVVLMSSVQDPETQARRLKKNLGRAVLMAWQDMALNLPLTAAYLMKDSVPDCGIPMSFHT